ncbi:6-bladed beta-propeller [Chitinophaga sp. Cy-1792]|uniref:6-bladed beta-propeller n=1 Tax=Chitinophaga sp. Cy-1792 TaxID=2608339 RepID=UPI0014248641|nr:6-bladed beta-propeller [Chitinophaga sp. Cy-1792]NIG53350.1 6-bladed beta-propeller [Chitinophaga sp. Cy-1792]
MNISKCRLIALLALVLSFSKTVFSQEVTKIRIDPASAYGGNVNDFFEKIEYIPLETNKESLFGDISRLIITDKSYIVYDWDTKSILFFATDGKFISRFKESENTQLDIFLDKQKEVVNLLIYNTVTEKTTLKLFTTDGKAIPASSKKAVDNNGEDFVPLGNNYYASFTNIHLGHGVVPKDSIYHRINIFKGDNLYKSLLPINQKDNLGICMLKGYFKKLRIVQDGSFFIALPLEHLVYKVNKDKAEKVYQFVFPADRTISRSYYSSNNVSVIDSIRKTLSQDQNIIMEVSNIFQKPPYLFFKINTSVYITQAGSESKNQYNFAYNLSTGQLISMERLTPDAANFYLPFLGQSARVNGLDYYSNHFYSSVSALKLFAEKEKNKDKSPQYPAVLEQFFQTQNRKSNPVIVKMKMKG